MNPLELNAWCQLAMFCALAWLDERDFFVQRLDLLELCTLSAVWPIGLLLVAAEWQLTRRGHR